ncbi:MAG: glutamate racemase [Treponema sp.]|jgi:glutamate racemase|nr:glutamate racemase [Treponema sp.]
MDNRPVLFLDSGIGGLPYCRYFHLRNPREPLVYTADRENFPYGSKSREELSAALISLTGQLIDRFRPKLAVLACNTASVSALAALRAAFPALPFVGTVPAVKPAVQESRKRRIGVLGTSRTIGDPYIAELAAQYGTDCIIRGIAAGELVDFVEYRYAVTGKAEKRRMVEPYIEQFRADGADGVVLGCTHFIFLLKEFRAAAAPDMKVYDSLEGVSRRAEQILDEGALRVESRPKTGEGDAETTRAGGAFIPGKESAAGNILFLTGKEPPGDWQRWAKSFGLTLYGSSCGGV